MAKTKTMMKSNNTKERFPVTDITNIPKSGDGWVGDDHHPDQR